MFIYLLSNIEKKKKLRFCLVDILFLNSWFLEIKSIFSQFLIIICILFTHYYS